jgi:hypothetical protein
MLAVQRFEHVRHPARSQGQVAAELSKALSELGEGLVDETEVQGAELRCVKELRLVNVEAEDLAAGSCFGERSMIVDSQVALEPNDLHALDVPPPAS